MAPSRPVLLYDARCGFCRRWVARLARMDPQGRIEQVPSEALPERPDLPRIPADALDQSVHLVLPDGRVLTEGRAVSGTLSLLPRWRIIAPVLNLPGISHAMDAGYRWVARRRHRFGCGPEGCGVDGG